MRLPRRERRKARIEIIPMIDVMAFLLMFFMMASLAMTSMTGLNVSLPKAAAGERTNTARAILTMTGRGELFLEKRPLRLDQVTAELRRRIAANPDLQVIVNADRSLRHGQVIELIDAAKMAAPKILSVATEPNPAVR